VAELSKVSVYSRSLAGIAGSNPAGAWIFVCCGCCVLSGRGLCDGPIPRPEESYRLRCVIVCGLETSCMRRPWPALGCCARNKQNSLVICMLINLDMIIYMNFSVATDGTMCPGVDSASKIEYQDTSGDKDGLHSAESQGNPEP
jgi:hypothetical protein